MQKLLSVVLLFLFSLSISAIWLPADECGSLLVLGGVYVETY